MDRLVIGKVIKPQGINGQIKVELPQCDRRLFDSLDEVYLDNKLYKIVQKKCLVNGIFFKLEGVDDRNQAELLRGKNIAVDRVNMPPLAEGRYYIVDLIGAKIMAGGVVLGHLTDVLQYGAADVYVVKGEDGHKDFMFPCIKSVLKSVDVDAKIICLDSEVMESIAVYED